MFCCCCCCVGDFGLCSCFGNSNNITNCCAYLTQKVFQIIFIMAYIFLIIFLIATMSIITWSKFPSINITVFLFIFFITLACLILGIFIYFYTQNTKLDEKIKRKISLVSNIGQIITIICLIISVLEEIFISLGFSQAKTAYPCDDVSYSVSTSVYVGFLFFKRKNSNFGMNTDIKRILYSEDDCYLFFITGAVLGMTYFTLTILELISIIAICFWMQYKREYAPNPAVQNYNAEYNTQNQKNPQEVVVQTPQIIIINQGNNEQYPQQNNINENNMNQNNINQKNNKVNNNNLNNINVIYPSQQNIINNNEKSGQNNINTNQNKALNSNNNVNHSERKGFI